VRKKLFLFDIDGTLISPGSVSRLTLNQVIVDHYNASPELTYDDVAGSTDPLIIRLALKKIGLKNGKISDAMEEVVSQYIHALEKSFNESDAPFIYQDCLKLLNDVLDSSHSLGLLTGNLKETAKIKLNKFHLWDLFPFGVFGDDAELRSDLPWIARERAWDVLEESFRLEDIVLIGDTENDAKAATMNGAKSVIVCRNAAYKNKIIQMGATVVVDNLDQFDLNSFV